MLGAFIVTTFFLALCRFFETLDARADDNMKKLKRHVPQRKTRIIGSPLQSRPPKNVPSWAISTQWIAG